MKGDVALGVSNGMLHVIMFTAPATHYYDAALPEVEALIASARISS
jgi:hypothetical protein